MMRGYLTTLKKYNLSISKEIFYVLLNCIDSSISTYEDLISSYESSKNFVELKQDYKLFYEFMIKYLNNIDINNEIQLNQEIEKLISIVLADDLKEVLSDTKMFISNVIDLIFIKYHLNIVDLSNDEEIRQYLISKLKNEKIVDILMFLLIEDTKLANKEITKVSEEEFKMVIKNIILISLYICKTKG